MYTGKCEPPNFRCMNVDGCKKFALSFSGSNVSFLFAEKSSSYGLYGRGYSARLHSLPYLSLFFVFSSLMYFVWRNFRKSGRSVAAWYSCFCRNSYQSLGAILIISFCTMMLVVGSFFFRW